MPPDRYYLRSLSGILRQGLTTIEEDSNGGAQAPRFSGTYGECNGGSGERTKDGCRPGAAMDSPLDGKALSERLALKPEGGKPAFRNFREGDGSGGIMRSPLRAIALPDYSRNVTE